MQGKSCEDRTGNQRFQVLKEKKREDKIMKQKKNSIVGWWIAAILVGFIMVLYIVTQKDFLFATKPTDIMELIAEDGTATKDVYVSIGVDGVVEHYAEMKHSINGIIPIGTDDYYLLWLDDGSFISLTAKGKKNTEKLQQIMNDTHSYLYGQTDALPEKLELKGRISTMDSEIEGYYKDALYAWDISASDGLTIYYVTIDTTETPLKSWLMWGFFAVLEVIIVVALVKEIKERKVLKAMPVQTAPVGEADVFGNINQGTYTDDNNPLYK